MSLLTIALALAPAALAARLKPTEREAQLEAKLNDALARIDHLQWERDRAVKALDQALDRGGGLQREREARLRRTIEQQQEMMAAAFYQGNAANAMQMQAQQLGNVYHQANQAQALNILGQWSEVCHCVPGRHEALFGAIGGA